MVSARTASCATLLLGDFEKGSDIIRARDRTKFTGNVTLLSNSSYSTIPTTTPTDAIIITNSIFTAIPAAPFG